jgi:hypothetical protein
MHPFHIHTHMATRRSSRTLRFWAIYGIMPLSELRTFHPRVHHRATQPAELGQLTTAHERRAPSVARLRDAADLVFEGPKPRSLVAGRSATRQLKTGACCSRRHCLRLQEKFQASPSKRTSKLVACFKHARKRAYSDVSVKGCMVTQVASSNIEIEAKSLKVPGITLVTQI